MLHSENLDSKIKTFWPKDGPPTQEVKKYVKKYSKEKIVIKCGGRVLLDQDLFNNFIEDVAILKKLGLTPLLVHGGGLGIKKKLDELNIESKFIMGLRVTDEKIIKIVENVMIEFNKEIVSALEKKSCKAKSITVRESNIIYVEQKNKELGYVGNPTNIDVKLINNFIQKNFVPVVAPMGLDEKGQAYNINADTAAGALATNLKSRRLLLMTDVKGVYDENNELISEIRSAQAEKLIYNEIIHGGMIPKIRTCVNVLNNNVKGVVIIDGRKPHSILFELFSDQGAGTLIRK
ncbi:MAG: acetylglutamate kinase [Pelagibacteraceae bacterium]|jgi:acetylglutamate kinase|nr:acetylglutamate kinase [Pelagibacteraceae bacterium]MDP6710515.1 acetylglutamate kinase [Pelagibacteraceae bacterium]|tara:strand:+ start:183 stop:1055 length:873 start_codon:yes stop_codon:yes gene_type:complete